MNPENIEATKTNDSVRPSAKELMAGPGQKPTSAHPTPNAADPTIKRVWIFLERGMLKSLEKIG
tara:strand:+ start:152 stop:343 length:192 start_codon:yes stop_codon:yes gene_type:complete